MSGDQKERRWFNTEIPLWGMILAAAAMSGWVINFEFRMRAMEAKMPGYEKALESYSRIAWQMDSIKDDISAIRADMKTVAKLNLDVTILQNDLAALDCRTGGRCSGRNDRGHK